MPGFVQAFFPGQNNGPAQNAGFDRVNDIMTCSSVYQMKGLFVRFPMMSTTSSLRQYFGSYAQNAAAHFGRTGNLKSSRGPGNRFADPSGFQKTDKSIEHDVRFP